MKINYNTLCNTRIHNAPQECYNKYDWLKWMKGARLRLRRPCRAREQAREVGQHGRREHLERRDSWRIERKCFWCEGALSLWIAAHITTDNTSPNNWPPKQYQSHYYKWWTRNICIVYSESLLHKSIEASYIASSPSPFSIENIQTPDIFSDGSFNTHNFIFPL